MQPLSSRERAYNFNELANNSFDILVIGGGITGAGVALDAVSRGYSVALVEKADFASGTSSKSTKLVHGGIRYLPNFDIALVHEALVERGLLLQNAPFLVNPVAFVLPIYEGDKHPVGMPFTTPKGIGLNRLLDAGLWMYDGLAGRRNISRHHHISRQEVLERAPTLISEGLKEGFIYYDGQTNDVRLTMTVLRTAARSGAVIANYAEVTGFEMSHDHITGAVVHDNIGDQQFTVRARHVVNATGVFSEQVESLTGHTPEIQVEPSKGVHLVLSREQLQLGDDAIVLPETEDKRILFIVPWESRAIYGTTDTGTGDLNHPNASQDDITYLLKYLNRYLSVNVTEDDIISTYAGYRPLVKPRQKNASTAKLSRTHAVIESPSGLVTITGGKLTTYRRMAQDTLDLISRRDSMKPVHPTESLPLQGSAAWPLTQHELQKRGTSLGLSSSIIQHLGGAYGSNANAVFDLIEQDASLGQQLISDLPYIKAEVIYACRYEMAMKPSDILARRTSIVLEDRERGQGVVDEVTRLMAQEFHWPSTEQQALMQTYRSNIQNQVLAEKH
ncbi:glycerol-3-phosphate dehydrogenase/oxidase [Dictyobacter kobayashii]|uniref:Glycerol-3-phosphate dehydrogenase n=1 Tax=Dictyobacter kobayashii TaxID=2014872 RepID=A0A402ALC6_9CHLR|nr:glycerol-3-phosphate dehydrogenase/oxidase [Dictyobacter kobayashii]GCE19998.1 glycerol-3-phosphate dehydrogenase [Dictyobacter kobayashii]